MLRKKLSVVGLALVVAACGGGDDGGGGGGTTEPVFKNGVITGSAVKGLIQNARVEIFQIPATGSPVRLGEGSTTAAGLFQVSYTGFVVGGGPVQVRVRAKTAAEASASPPATTVLCDVSDGADCGPSNGDPADTNANGTFDLGEAIPVPAFDSSNPGSASNFQINLCLPEPPAAGIAAPVTPFTEIVFQRAQERAANAALAANLTEGLLEAASEINQLVGGLDVQRLEAIDLSDPVAVANATPDQLAYSALVAAVLAEQVEGGAGGADALLAAISDLIAETDGGQILAADLQDLLAEAQEELLAQGLSDESGVYTVIQQSIDSAGAGGTVNPEPQAGAGDDRITRAKNLVQNVRDTVNGLNELEAPGTTFQTQLDLVAALMAPTDPLVFGPAEAMVNELSDVLLVAELCVNEYVTQQPAPDDGGVFFVPGDCLSDGVHTHTSTADNAAQTPQSYTVTVTGTDPVTATIDNGSGGAGGYEDILVDLTATFPRTPETNTAQTLTASVSGTIESDPAVDPGTGLRFTLATGTTATLVKTVAAALDDGSGQIDETKISSVSFNMPSLTLVQVREGAQEGGPVSFAGSLSAAAVRCTKATCVERETGDFDGDGFADGPTFTPSSFDISGVLANTDYSTSVSFSLDVANAASFDPDVARSQNANNDGDTLSSTNFPQTTATLQFDVDFAGAPPARVVLAGTLEGIFDQPDNDGTGTDAAPDGTVTLTLLRDATQVFRAQAISIDAGNTTDISTTISDSTGAQLVLYHQEGPDNQIADDRSLIRVDGVQVGEVQELSTGLLILRYADGTFETLF